MRICLLSLLLLIGCASHPSGWQKQDAGPFSFWLPSGFQKTPEHGIDSYVSVFESPHMTVDFDCGAYSGNPLDSLGQRAGSVSHRERINGHEVQIVLCDLDSGSGQKFQHRIVASFLGFGLSMHASCETAADYDTAIQIFRTVRFE